METRPAPAPAPAPVSQPEPELAEDDPHRHAHIVRPPSAVLEALMNGTDVVALCGHRFKPVRDPQRFPVCQRCLEIRKMVEPGLTGQN